MGSRSEEWDSLYELLQPVLNESPDPLHDVKFKRLWEKLEFLQKRDTLSTVEIFTLSHAIEAAFLLGKVHGMIETWDRSA